MSKPAVMYQDRIEEVLADYLASKGDEARREALVLECLPYIKAIVAKVANPVPHVLTFEDLTSHGVMGFLGALGRFDPARGTPFKAYVYSRVYGAAVDAVRKASPTSRTRNVQFHSITEVIENESSDYSDAVEGSLPEKVTLALKRSLSQLPPRQACVLLMLMNGLKIGAVAKAFDMSPSRVSQERQRGLDQLRVLLTDSIQ